MILRRHVLPLLACERKGKGEKRTVWPYFLFLVARGKERPNGATATRERGEKKKEKECGWIDGLNRGAPRKKDGDSPPIYSSSRPFPKGRRKVAVYIKRRRTQQRLCHRYI